MSKANLEGQACSGQSLLCSQQAGQASSRAVAEQSWTILMGKDEDGEAEKVATLSKADQREEIPLKIPADH